MLDIDGTYDILDFFSFIELMLHDSHLGHLNNTEVFLEFQTRSMKLWMQCWYKLVAL